MIRWQGGNSPSLVRRSTESVFGTFGAGLQTLASNDSFRKTPLWLQGTGEMAGVGVRRPFSNRTSSASTSTSCPEILISRRCF